MNPGLSAAEPQILHIGHGELEPLRTSFWKQQGNSKRNGCYLEYKCCTVCSRGLDRECSPMSSTYFPL